jgi:hypothetical protein
MTSTTTTPTVRPAIAAARRGDAPAVRAGASSSPTPTSTVPAYGLRQPSVVDARACIERIYGADEADAIWNELTGNVRAAAGIEEVVTTMLASHHDVVHLCGRALQIRLRTFVHLSAAQALVG